MDSQKHRNWFEKSDRADIGSFSMAEQARKILLATVGFGPSTNQNRNYYYTPSCLWL